MDDAALEIRARAAEACVTALQDRLEMRHAWRMIDGTMTRVEVELGSIPDGIECRDETIKLHDKYIKELEARVAQLRGGLEEIANHWANSYDHPYANTEQYRGSYGIGIVDGHRACTIIARAALAETKT